MDNQNPFDFSIRSPDSIDQEPVQNPPVMAAGFVNYFANTALDETDNLPPQAPPPRPRRTAAVRRTESEDMPDWTIGAPHAPPFGRSMTAERRAGYIEVFSKQEPALKAAYHKALDYWKKQASADAELYLNFAHNAVVATTSVVTATAIMTWYPALPFDVKAALDELCKYYYGEAWVAEHLAEAERSDGSNGINPEVKKAAGETNMKFPPSEERKTKAAWVRYHVPFGTGQDISSVATFERFDHLWYNTWYGFSWQQRLLKILANFRVRKILLHKDVPKHWKRIGYFDLSVDWQVCQWVDNALHYLEDTNVASAATKEAGATYAEVLKKLKRFNKRKDCRAIVNARKQCTEIYIPRMQIMLQMPDGEEKDFLREHLHGMKAVYEKLEAKHGPVVGDWKKPIETMEDGELDEAMKADFASLFPEEDFFPEEEDEDAGNGVYPRTSEAGDENEDPDEVL